jgi:hypothetical protein
VAARPSHVTAIDSEHKNRLPAELRSSARDKEWVFPFARAAAFFAGVLAFPPMACFVPFMPRTIAYGRLCLVVSWVYRRH